MPAHTPAHTVQSTLSVCVCVCVAILLGLEPFENDLAYLSEPEWPLLNHTDLGTKRGAPDQLQDTQQPTMPTQPAMTNKRSNNCQKSHATTSMHDKKQQQ